MRVNQPTREFPRILPILIVLLAAVVRIHGVRWGLPDVFEEATPLRRAWEMWGWGPSRGLDLNPHFFNYPSLTIYLQLLGQGILYLLLAAAGRIHGTIDFRVLYITDPTPFLIMGRAITILFAVGTVGVVYAIGKRIGGLACAVTAALLLALNPLHMAQSVVVEVDVPLTFFVALCLFYVLRIPPARGGQTVPRDDQSSRTPIWRNYAMAGLAAGLAASAKYTGAFLILPLLAGHLIARREGSREKKKPARKPGWNLLLLSGGVAIAAFAVTSPFVFLDPKTFWHDLSFERTHMRLGQFGSGDESTLVFYAGALANRLLGWPSTLLLMAGLAYFLIAKRTRWPSRWPHSSSRCGSRSRRGT